MVAVFKEAIKNAHNNEPKEILTDSWRVYREGIARNFKDVDHWSQSRIIFISPEFTKYQQHAIGFKDVGIQLWEVHKYNNGLLVFNDVKSPSTKESITTIAKNNAVVKKVTKEIKVYAEEDHLKEVDNNIKELYSELKSAVSTLGNDIEIRTKKHYVAYICIY